MNDDLQGKLLCEFPEIFGDDFYFEVGNGWYELIRNLCTQIRTIRSHPKATIVKSKFGSLRFYTDVHNDQVESIIAIYEGLSRNTCEYCGNPGKAIKKSGWISVICDVCYVHHE